MNARNLSLLICLSFLSYEASANFFGDVKDFFGLSPKSRISVPWSCPVGPGATEVQVTYNESGRISFKPNVFKNHPSGENIAACRDEFIREADKKISEFKSTNCPDNRKPLCWMANPIGGLGLKLNQSPLFVATGPRNGTTPDLDQDAEHCPEPKLDERITDLLAVVNILKKAPDCGPMDPGTSRLSNTRRQGNSSSRMLEGEYLLNRKDDGNYEAVLNVVFNNVSGKNGEDWMRKRVESCLSVAAPYLKGPNDELINIKLASADDIRNIPRGMRPKPFVVNVYDTYPRAVATNLPENADCSTLTHETIHQFGLCDEYHEKTITGYNCRPNTMVTNIMSDSFKAFAQTVPRQLTCACDSNCQSIMKNPLAAEIYLSPEIMEVLPSDFTGAGGLNCKQTFIKDSSKYGPGIGPYVVSETSTELNFGRRVLNAKGELVGVTHMVCPCDNSQASCRTVKKQMYQFIQANPRRSVCPYSAGMPPQKLNMEDEAWGKWGGGNLEPRFNADGTLSFSSRPGRKSLMGPQQFNRIIGGHCAGSAGVYHQCSEFAYKGSLSNDCGLPAQCADAESYPGLQQ